MHQSRLLSLSSESPKHGFGSKKLPKVSQGKPWYMYLPVHMYMYSYYFYWKWDNKGIRKISWLCFISILKVKHLNKQPNKLIQSTRMRTYIYREATTSIKHANRNTTLHCNTVRPAWWSRTIKIPILLQVWLAESICASAVWSVLLSSLKKCQTVHTTKTLFRLCIDIITV